MTRSKQLLCCVILKEYDQKEKHSPLEFCRLRHSPGQSRFHAFSLKIICNVDCIIGIASRDRFVNGRAMVHEIQALGFLVVQGLCTERAQNFVHCFNFTFIQASPFNALNKKDEHWIYYFASLWQSPIFASNSCQLPCRLIRCLHHPQRTWFELRLLSSSALLNCKVLNWSKNRTNR